VAGIDGYTSVTGAKSGSKRLATRSASLKSRLTPNSVDIFNKNNFVKDDAAVTPAVPFSGYQPAFSPVGAAPSVSTTPGASYLGGGGYSGGIAGGAPGAPAPIGAPSNFDKDALEKLLTSIEARYGLSREELLADTTEVGNLYRFLNSNLGNLEREASAGEQESAIGRGILRSGIYLANAGRVERDFAERRSQAEAEKAQKLGFIESSLANLQKQLEEEKSKAAIGFGNEGVNYAADRAGASL
jgi:hypothetical protein